jgi:hypothetical protein
MGYLNPFFVSIRFWQITTFSRRISVSRPGDEPEGA